MNDLREEIGMQFSLMGRIFRSWILREGRLVPMEEGAVPKKAQLMKQPWEDCH